MWNRFKKYVFNSEISEELPVKSDKEDSSVDDSDNEDLGDEELNYKTINWNYVFKVDNYLETLTIRDTEALNAITSAAETSNYSGPFIMTLPQNTCPPPPGSFIPLHYTPFGGRDAFVGLKETVRNIISDIPTPIVLGSFASNVKWGPRPSGSSVTEWRHKDSSTKTSYMPPIDEDENEGKNKDEIKNNENINDENICDNFVELCVQWETDNIGYSTEILRFNNITPNELNAKIDTCRELFRKIGIIYHLIDYMDRNCLGMFSLQKSITLLGKTIQIKKMIIRSGINVVDASNKYTTRNNEIIYKEYNTKLSLQSGWRDGIDISYNFVNQVLDN